MVSTYTQPSEALAAFMLARQRFIPARLGLYRDADSGRANLAWCAKEGDKLARNLSPETTRLAMVAHRLQSSRDVEFALSLLRQSSEGKRLSAKQLPWVVKLAERAEG